MKSSYHQLFERLPVETPVGLNQTIIKTLRLKEARWALQVFWLNVGLLVVAIGGLLEIGYQTFNSLSHTDLIAYANLAWYDYSLLFSNWREVISWIVESIPILTIAMTLGLVIVIGLSSINSVSSYKFKRLLIN